MSNKRTIVIGIIALLVLALTAFSIKELQKSTVEENLTYKELNGAVYSGNESFVYWVIDVDEKNLPRLIALKTIESESRELSIDNLTKMAAEQNYCYLKTHYLIGPSKNGNENMIGIYYYYSETCIPESFMPGGINWVMDIDEEGGIKFISRMSLEDNVRQYTYEQIMNMSRDERYYTEPGYFIGPSKKNTSSAVGVYYYGGINEAMKKWNGQAPYTK